MDATPEHDQAAALRYIALTVLVLHPVINDEMWLTYPEEKEAPVPWYRGRCHEVCAAVLAIATELAGGDELDFQAELIHGMFRYDDDPEPRQHAWFQLPDRTIVDPTSSQMGLKEAVAVIRADDPRQRHYDSSETWKFHTAAEDEAACATSTDAGPPPDFDDVYSDLNAAGRLLTALATDDEKKIDELRQSADADWRNVAWTLALLLRGVREHEEPAVKLVDSLLGNEPDAPTAGGG
jgi:hypothetical protein